MASYDQLPAQQRAIVDLILKRGQSYDQLADRLDMPSARVRELARETLVTLAPVSAAAVDVDRRDEIADYLLNQQSATEAATTRSVLRRSEAARAWSRSVLDSLEHLYDGRSLPTIPSGEDAPEPSPRTKAARELSPEAQAVIRKRRLIGAGAAAALLAFVLLVWPVGFLTGDDDGGAKADGDQAASGDLQIVGQVQLRRTPGAAAKDAGIAILSREKGKLQLNIQAQLEPTKRNQAYEVWLYNSPQDAKSLGAQVTDAQGGFAGKAELPSNYRDYKFIDISRETVDRNTAHSGQSVLRARVSAIKPVRN